jgi:hypothetical protein
LFVEAPVPLSWNARLDRGARILGRVLDHKGEPAADVSVLFETIPTALARNTQVRMSSETLTGEEISERGEAQTPLAGAVRTPWVDSVAVCDDGTFELSNLPQSLGRLLVVSSSDRNAPALVIEEGVMPGGHELLLRLPAKSATLQIRATLPPLWQEQQMEMRVVHEASGRGCAMTRQEGIWRSPALAPGWYLVEAGAGPLGWHDLGRHFVGDGESVVLPDFAPAPPARVRVHAPKAAEGAPHAALDLTIYLRRADMDVRGLSQGLDGKQPLELPAGEYWAFWTWPDGTKQHRAFTLASGDDFELNLRD